MNLTDQDIAKSFNTWKAKRYPNALPQHLRSYLGTYLEPCSWYEKMFPIDQIKLVNRVLMLLRSDAAHNMVNTKKRTTKHKKKRDMAARAKSNQLLLL